MTVNILNLHKMILTRFEQDQEEKKNIYTHLKNLTSLLEKITDKDLKRGIEQDIESTKIHLQNLERNTDQYFYKLRITPLIEEYKKELNKPLVLNFMGDPVKQDNTKKNQLEQDILGIIREFGIYQDDTDDLALNADNDYVCENCKNTDMFISDDNILMCKTCGIEKDVFHITFSYKDVDRINITTKYTYDRKIHFRDCINQFQGKQNSTISDKVYNKLTELLERHNVIPKDKTIPKKQRFAKVSKKHIYMFLKEAEYSKHYEDINLIYHNLTGKSLPDISHLEEQLMKDFDVLSELYEQEYIKTQKITRKSFINTQYVLYQLLKRHKFECKKEDFNFLKTTERKSFHDEICSNLFSKLGWNFINTF